MSREIGLWHSEAEFRGDLAELLHSRELYGIERHGR